METAGCPDMAVFGNGTVPERRRQCPKIDTDRKGRCVGRVAATSCFSEGRRSGRRIFHPGRVRHRKYRETWVIRMGGAVRVHTCAVDGSPNGTLPTAYSTGS